jgi:hypothetical protein
MNENLNIDVDAYRHMLREIADLCEHASLTGSLNGGESRVARRYNAVLARLEEGGILPAGMFDPVPDSGQFGEIGVEARMLAAYLSNDRKEKRKERGGDPGVLVRLAPFVRPEDLAALVRQQMESGARMDMDLVTHLAPFLDQNALGELLQEHLRGPKAAPTPPTPPTPPSPPTPPVPPVSPVPPFAHEPIVPLPEALPAPASTPPQEDRVLVLLERLKDPRLSTEERAEIIDRVRALTRA